MQEQTAKEGVLARAALRCAAWSERWFPDAWVFAALGVVIVAVAALAFGATPKVTVGAFGDGFWSLIPFTMQMALVAIGGVQQAGDAVFEFQQAGQVGVLADLALDGAGVQFKLTLAVLAEAANPVVLTDPEAEVTQSDHQGDDQGGQEQMANQTGFHGE